MTDFEIEKTMITGMVKSTFKGVRVVSAGWDDTDDGSFRIMIPKKAAEKCVIRYVFERVRKCYCKALLIRCAARQGGIFRCMNMKYETVEKKMLAGFMPGGYAAVTRRQVAFFLMQLFGVDESSITRWRVRGDIPPKRSERLIKLFPEFKEDK